MAGHSTECHLPHTEGRGPSSSLVAPQPVCRAHCSPGPPRSEALGGRRGNQYFQGTRQSSSATVTHGKTPAPSLRPTIFPSTLASLLLAPPLSHPTVIKRSQGTASTGAIGLLRIPREVLHAKLLQLTEGNLSLFLDQFHQCLISQEILVYLTALGCF